MEEREHTHKVLDYKPSGKHLFGVHTLNHMRNAHIHTLYQVQISKGEMA